MEKNKMEGFGFVHSWEKGIIRNLAKEKLGIRRLPVM